MVPADSRRIPRAPRYSGYRYASSRFVYGPVTLYGPTFQKVPLTRFLATARSYNPRYAVTYLVWALPRSLATTRGIIIYFLFLQVLRCFRSLREPPALRDNVSSRHWVVPFGNPRIKGHLHLPAAYRSLSRPSSPPRAKASAMCPFLLFCRFTSKPCGYGRNILSALTLLFLLQHVIDRRNIPVTVSRKGLAAPILLFLGGE